MVECILELSVVWRFLGKVLRWVGWWGVCFWDLISNLDVILPYVCFSLRSLMVLVVFVDKNDEHYDI